MRRIVPGLLPAVLLAFSSAARGGYDFSISASSTDPFQNAAAPADSSRNLYLWMTCTDDGLSAFEGDLSGTLDVRAFVPLNGVMNAGGAADIMLAVVGCPIGEQVDFLLGYWIVNDTGGAVCLVPSQRSNLLGAVDCQGDPVLTQDPSIVGFASDGGSPCATGANGCEVQWQGGSGWGSMSSE